MCDAPIGTTSWSPAKKWNGLKLTYSRGRGGIITPPTTPKPAWSPPSAELPPALVEKACSQFWIRIKAVIETEGGYIE